MKQIINKRAQQINSFADFESLKSELRYNKKLTEKELQLRAISIQHALTPANIGMTILQSFLPGISKKIKTYFNQ